jgi:BirA family transcriptional regulator, biotin operon repressor / biotin---[acetyl-CoA-carboxylase] ligase
MRMILGEIFKARVHLASCWSTNDTLKSIIEDSEKAAASEGWYVTAGYQTHGRGQGPNTWYSSKESNLLLSFHATPHGLDASHQFIISRIIALALFDTISGLLAPDHAVYIKWPNDIYAGSMKIGGILVENQIMGSEISSSVIGIGININEDQFPSALPNPVSLFQLTRQKMSVESFLQLLIHRITARSRIDSSAFGSLHHEYDRRLWRLNTLQHYKDTSGDFRGIITGTDEFGQLIVNRGATTTLYGFKEIEFL